MRIPFGSGHLPLDQVLRGDGQAAENTLGAAPFVQEALRWLTGGTANEESLTTDLANEDLAGFLEQEREPAGAKRARVLLADDNRDMREYVQRLLARKYDVTAVADGEEALAAARENPPDLVLTDVMMPRMDGFGLLQRAAGGRVRRRRFR